MSTTITNTDVELKSLVNLAGTLRARFEDRHMDRNEVAVALDDFLLKAAMMFDGSDITDVTSDQFKIAVETLQEHVWVDRSDSVKALEIEISKIAESFKWPPNLPAIAVVINLVRGLLRTNIERVNLSIKRVVDFDFDAYPHAETLVNRNGWAAFFLVYHKAIMAA